MNIKQRIKNYSTASLLLLFTSFFLIFAIKPSVELIVSLFHEKDELSRIDKTLEIKIQNIIQAQNTYMTLAENIDVLDKALPQKMRITDIKQLLASSSATIDSLSIEQQTIIPSTADSLTPIVISLTTQGEYSQIKKFVGFLIQRPRIFTVEQIQLGKAEGTESAQLKTPMIINSYFYAPK